ncbi:MAG: hypothetical protein PHO89_06310 [Methylacidiphilaceae bacterium]|nr:hypothetical protein [Candidatus Methylacidiphilaceae bacterium]
MLVRVATGSRSLFLMGTLTAGWLLSMELLPSHAFASSDAATDSSSEWKTTHSEEQSAPPSSEAGTKSTNRKATPAASQTGRKRSAASSKASGSAAKEHTGNKGQEAAKETKPEPIGIQLEKLFRGIGADLEEFFVGTRTVDKDD